MVPRVFFNEILWFSSCFWLNVTTSLIHNPPAEPAVSPAIRLEVSGATSSRSQALVEVSSYPVTGGYQGISIRVSQGGR